MRHSDHSRRSGEGVGRKFQHFLWPPPCRSLSRHPAQVRQLARKSCKCLIQPSRIVCTSCKRGSFRINPRNIRCRKANRSKVASSSREWRNHNAHKLMPANGSLLIRIVSVSLGNGLADRADLAQPSLPCAREMRYRYHRVFVSLVFPSNLKSFSFSSSVCFRTSECAGGKR